MIDNKSEIELKKKSILLSKDILNSAVEKFGDRIKVIYDKRNRSKIMVDPEIIVETAIFLRDNHGFDHVESASGTDYPKEDQIEINYHLGSYVNPDLFPYVLVLSTKTNRDDPKTNSLINILPSVEYFERETYEMLGVYFIGHPRNERFLLPEDWADIPPLRKDFRLKGR
ncbi:NADH-quinone oxidoreductase subunit C [soil metagenome]